MSVVATRNSIPDLAAIVAWENDRIVDRYARMFGESREESLACFEAWKQFIAASAVRGPSTSVPSRHIDEMWHTALVFTEVYREFCDAFVGRFLDHDPQEHSNPAGYLATRDTAMELFGTLNPRYWTADPASCGGDCT